MSDFDPYHKWLGIPPRDQPPNHYRLLGLELFESDPDVIDAAAEQRMLYVNQCSMGEHLELSQRLLNELSAARLCLLSPKQRPPYDAGLRVQFKKDELVEIIPEMPQIELLVETSPFVRKSGKSSQTDISRPVSNRTPLRSSTINSQAASKDSSENADVDPLVDNGEVIEIVETGASSEVVADSLKSPTGKVRPSKSLVQTLGLDSLTWQSWQIWFGTCLLLVASGVGAWFLWPARAEGKKTGENSLVSVTPSAMDSQGIESVDTEKNKVEESTENSTPNSANSEQPQASFKKSEESADDPADGTESVTMKTPATTSVNDNAIENTSPPPTETHSESQPLTDVRSSNPIPFDATRERSPSEAIQAQQNWAAFLQTAVVERNDLIGMEFILIPPGSINLNNSSSSNVELTKPFRVSKTEITQRQWYRIMQDDPARGQPWLDKKPPVKVDDDCPVTYVNWRDAREFCRKLTARDKTGYRYRLLTEAEWEFACRAGGISPFSSGQDSSTLESYARFADNSSAINEKYAHQVAQLKPNPFGLYDMLGNSWEWCQDRFQSDLPDGTDPVITSASGTRMVTRGGCWNDKAEDCTAFSRTPVNCLSANHYLGFRVARELGAPPPPSTVIVDKFPVEGTPPALINSTAAVTEEMLRDAQRNWASFLNTKSTVTNSQGMELELIPPGRFRMGNPATAGKTTEVTISMPIWVAKTEVTQQQWWDVQLTAPWESSAKERFRTGRDYAASNMTWEDAKKFCAELGRLENAQYRLLTEAEWEYVCRGGTSTLYSYGDDGSDLGDYAWFEKNALDQGEDYPHEVAQLKPNVWGLYDLHGNVMEWCEDEYGESLPGGKNPLVSKGGLSRSCRGGWWGSSDESCSSFHRARNSKDDKLSRIGFRVVRIILEK